MVPLGTIADRFELEYEAGAGGMGTVYRARDLTTQETVAVKVLQAQGLADARHFLHEVSLLAELTHPGIVRYVAHGTTAGGDLYLAMEWLDGEDLARYLARRRPSTTEVLVLARRVATALAMAHRAGIVHRDVKPGNIFLQGATVTRPKLLDFGIARRFRDAGTTRPGTPIGTPQYMAPEQVRGEREVTTRADVFALGAVIFECLTGRPPFTGENAVAVMLKVLLDEAPRLQSLCPDASAALDDLVARMLDRDPALRPADADAVAAELDALRAGSPRPLVSMLPPVSMPPLLTSLPPLGLTRSEQRVLCIVLSGRVDPVDRTPAPSDLDQRRQRLRDAIVLHDARAEFLANGVAIVTPEGDAVATDLAARAARCALAVRAVNPDGPLVVATGRGVLAARLPVGEVIDRAVELLGVTPTGSIRIDEATAGLLDARFDLVPDGAKAFWLRGERDARETTRTLLGRPSPCVGRDRELATLDAVLAECVADEVARVVLVTAAPGAGKSRLRYEFLRRLAERGEHEVLVGRGDSQSEGSPFALLATALRGAAGILAGDPAEAQRQKLRARLGRHLPASTLQRTATFLGELARVPFPDEGLPWLRAARSDARVMGDAMRAAWEDWLAAECAARPVILVLEDLHWGDLPTVTFVAAALRHLKNQPFLVLALARPEVHDRFPELWSAFEPHVLRLGRLGRAASRRLVHAALGPEVSEAVLERVIERAGGNAFFLEELIRAVSRGAAEALPDTLVGMVQSHLDALGAEARRTLRAASVFGERFWRGGVVELLGGARRCPGVDTELDALVEREVVAPAASSAQDDGEYVFRHAIVREAAYAMLTEPDRVLGHRLAGRWLERRGPTDALALAGHFHRGQDRARAAHWYRRSAEQALEGNDLAAAIERARAGVSCDAQGEVLAALGLVQAVAHAWRGEQSEAGARSAEALEAAPAASPLWFRAADELIVASGRLGHYDRVETLVTEALGAAPLDAARGARIICLCRGGLELVGAARYPAVDALIARLAEPYADPLALDDHVAAQLHLLLAARAMHAGDPAGCLAGVQDALAALERCGNERDACLTRSNLGWVLAVLGDFPRAEEALRQAIATAERMGLAHVATAALHNLGPVLAARGAMAEALEVEDRAVQAFRAQGHVRLEGGARVYLSAIACRAGDYATAEAEARRASELLSAVPAPRAEALAALTRALIAQARTGEALDAAREAMTLLEKLGGHGELRSTVRLAYAEALEASGDRDAARAGIAQARDALLQRASRIGDREWRTSFLERVPDNALTLDLARRWGAEP